MKNILATLLLASTAVLTMGQPNCNNPVSSPQTAQLCRLGSWSSVLSIAHCQNPGGLNLLYSTLLYLLGAAANDICDTDCRCIMGATARGGACGVNAADGLTYCICDYNRTPVITPTNPIIAALGCPNIPFFEDICAAAGTVCNDDCICSHGNPNNGAHSCTTNNGDSGNTQGYCVCNNHTNYQ